MPENTDGAFDRFVSYLKKTAPADPAAVSRIVRAAAAGDTGERKRGSARWLAWLVRPRTFTVRAVAGLATAATISGLMLGHALDSAIRNGNGSSAAADGTAGMEPLQLPVVLQGVSDAAEASERPVSVQFVLVAPRAHDVALVGDFNGWDPAAAPLRRDSAGIWSGTITLPPGRHAYAFIVDDSVWTPDPRLPRTEDADYGRPNSVIIVGGI